MEKKIKNIRMLMFDLDGTLLNYRNRILDSSLLAFENAHKQGILLGIATGRPWHFVDQLITKYKLKDLISFVVCMNGMDIYDYHTKTYLEDLPLTKQQITTILKSCLPLNIKSLKHSDDSLFLEIGDEKKSKIKSLRRLLQIGDYDSNSSGFINRIIVLKNSPFTKTELEHLPKYLSYDYFGSLTSPSNFEIYATGLSKYTAIDYLAVRNGFTSKNVVAFGDSSNDIDMLKHCGVGVCMANGTLNAKQAADYITDSNNNKNGIADFLNTHILKV